MKNKHKRVIMQQFPWYDYSYLLGAIELWCSQASEMHKKKGCSLHSDKTSRQLRVAAHLCKRLMDDDYSNPFWFGEVTIKSTFHLLEEVSGRRVHFERLPNDKVFRLCQQKQVRQRQADLDMLTKLINKHLFGWWD